MWSASPPSALPALGDSASADLDINDERRLGERIMRDIRRDPDYLDDPLLGEYLEGLWRPLLAASRNSGDLAPTLDQAFAWKTFLVRDRSINAFALPGGYVGVHLGLMALTASPDELASVLAHEMSHVTQRHIARSMENSSRQGLASMAAMILGVIAAGRAGSVDAAQAVIMGSQAAMIQGQLNFSRDMEREADRIGMQVLTGAGFASSGMAAMFEKLEGSSRLNDSNQYPYLRSHPLTIDRISEARLRMQSNPSRRSAMPGVHALMQMRARVLVDRGEPALRRYQAAGNAGGVPLADSNRLAALYGSALASGLLREYERADLAIQAGLTLADASFGQEPQVRRDFELLRLEQRADQAKPGILASLAASTSLKPASRVSLLARAQALLAARRAGEAEALDGLKLVVQDLQTWVVEHRSDALAWQALSEVGDAVGQRLRSLRAAAEAAAAQGDVIGAVDRFRFAQQAARNDPQADFVEATIIESRLREAEAVRRRYLAEMRGERVE